MWRSSVAATRDCRPPSILPSEAQDVVVFEAAAEIGLGASGLSGGQVNPGIKYDPDEIETGLRP